MLHFVLDQTNFITRPLRWSLVSDERGDSSATIDVPRAWVETRPGARCAVTDMAGTPLWVGFVNKITVSADTMTVEAIGLTQALRNVRYTAFWSDTRYNQWRIPPPEAWSDWFPQAWQHDTNNRLYATTRPNETYGGTTGARRAMAWAYQVPHRSLTGVSWGQGAMELTGGMWQWAWTSIATAPESSAWPIGTVTTISASGTVTHTSTSSEAFVLRTVPPNTALTETNPSGARAFRATSLRVANHAPPITADEIVVHALSHAQSVLSNNVLAGWNVQPHSDDQEIAVWEDATVDEVLTWAETCTGYTWWVERSGQSIVMRNDRPRYQWAASPNAVTTAIGNERIVTRAYARYRNPAGNRVLRTTTAINTNAEQHNRIARVAAIDVATISEIVANAARNTHLAQAAQQPPTVTVTCRRLGDLISPNGGALPWAAAPGDEMLIPGIDQPLRIVRRTITRNQTTYELTAPAGTFVSVLAGR